MRRLLAGSLVLSSVLAAPDRALGLTVQEAILRAKPAVALITARVEAEVTLNCGEGLVTVRPAPFVETGTGWFVDGRGYLITNAHVVDPAYRLPAWVTHELKKKAIDLACVEPALKARGLTRGLKPDVEDQIRRDASARALPSAKLTPLPQLTVALSSGAKLAAEVKKFSALLLLDNDNKPLPGSGRDLALLRVPDGDYPALSIGRREPQIGDPVHILGFPNVVLAHELLNKTATIEASVTNGAVSGFNQDAIGQALVQTDAAAAHGNSGGPAIGDDSELVGVMLAVSLSGESIVQGFNFLIPAKDVLKFLQGTEVTKPGDSRFTPVWVSGLEALFAERYSTAASRFAEANRLIPNLPDVKKQLNDAEFKVKNPPPRPFPWAWATFGVTLVSVSVYGGMWGRRWWKNRYRILPAQVIGAIEKGLRPILVDARTKTDYETSPLKLHGSVRLDPEEAQAGRINVAADAKQMLVVYCTSPEEQTSAHVAQILRQRGFGNVRILKGGLGGWTNARLPVEAKSHLPAIGLEIYKNLTLGDVERRKFKAGEVICREGDPGNEAYVVHSGAVDVRRQIAGAERVLARLGEGELIGDMALFRKSSRSADLVAASDVELLIITQERLDWLIRNRTELTLEILKRLSELVVSTDSQRAQRAGS